MTSRKLNFIQNITNTLAVLLLISINSTVNAQTFTGVIDVIWGDGKPQQSKLSTINYTLTRNNNVKIPLKIKKSVIEEAGGWTKVKGKQVIVDIPTYSNPNGTPNNKQLVRSIKLNPNYSDTNRLPPQPLAGPQEYVSILCKFSDKPNEPQNWDYFNNMYGNSVGQLGHYWKEVSSNNINMSGSNAYGGSNGSNGWFTLPSPRSAYVNANFPQGNKDLLFTDCVGLADAYIDFTNVKGINLMFNDTIGIDAANNFAWGGTHVATLDGVSKSWPTTWEPDWGWTNVSVMAHEMGHSFGLSHSNNSDNDGYPYDSPWSVMSDTWVYGITDPTYGTRGQHLNAFEKETLNWLTTNEVITIPEDNQSTTIEVDSLSMTVANAGSYRLVKIPFLDGTGYYTIESRLKTGDYEASLPGEAIIIHSVIPNRAEPSWVIDQDNPPADYADTEGTMWKVGESFIDGTNNIKITINTQTNTGFQITVDRTPLPQISSPSPNTTLSGATETFSWATNNAAVTAWQLLIGTTVGGNDIYSYSGNATSTVVTSIPTDGSTVYVRLLYQIDNVWLHSDSSYNAANIIAKCPTGTFVNNLSLDTFEGGLAVWSHTSAQGDDAWSLSTSNPANGTSHVHGHDLSTTSDSYIKSNLSLALPANAFMFFNHSYNFESQYDGGVVEYTTDNGTTWTSAEALFTHNGYNSTLSSGNPLGGIPAYSSTSAGYISSRLDLNSLAGNNIDFRFRIGSDSSIGANGWDIDDVQIYTCGASPLNPNITSPVGGSTLTSSTVTFELDTRGVAVTNWYLKVGSTMGGNDIANRFAAGSSNTITIDNLPTDNSSIYVQLQYKLNGTWHISGDYPYTTSGPVTLPLITTPVTGSTLSSSTETFALANNGITLTNWNLRVGTSVGGNNIANRFAAGSSTSIVVGNLPTDSSTIYVRLQYKENGTWKAAGDYTYTASAPLSLPLITSPIAGSTLSSSSETFTLNNNGIALTNWNLRVGTSVGGSNIANRFAAGSTTNIPISSLPTDSSAIYVRLQYKENGTWKVAGDYTYTASAPISLPLITSPITGSTLSSSSETFLLNNNGITLTNWNLRVGTSVGDNNIANRFAAGSASSINISGLPTDSSAVYVRLQYKENGVWKIAGDYIYTASN